MTGRTVYGYDRIAGGITAFPAKSYFEAWAGDHPERVRLPSDVPIIERVQKARSRKKDPE